MIPWVHLGTGSVPGADEPLRLMRRGSEFSIMLGANELMNSRLSGSEEAMADLANRRLEGVPEPHVLIGGLGMGFTLRAALVSGRAGLRLTVAELVPSVVEWARGPLSHIHGSSLDDPRVHVELIDVADLIERSAAAFDAILLDVDNGPAGLTSPRNDRLYDARGLAAARRALRPGGLLSVWSSAPDDAFTARLRRSGFEVEEVRIRANARKRGARHTVWLARR